VRGVLKNRRGGKHGTLEETVEQGGVAVAQRPAIWFQNKSKGSGQLLVTRGLVVRRPARRTDARGVKRCPTKKRGSNAGVGGRWEEQVQKHQGVVDKSDERKFEKIADRGVAGGECRGHLQKGNKKILHNERIQTKRNGGGRGSAVTQV